MFEKNDKMEKKLKKNRKKIENFFFSNFLKVHSKDAHEKNRENNKKISKKKLVSMPKIDFENLKKKFSKSILTPVRYFFFQIVFVFVFKNLMRIF